QLDAFAAVVAPARALGFRDLIVHAAATGGAIRVPAARFDMVRIGLGLHGVHPSPATRSQLDLAPTVALVSRLIEVRELAPGERIGYGFTYEVPDDRRHRRYGIVPAGYNDGVPIA